MKNAAPTDRYLVLSEISEPMRLRVLFIIASRGEACAVDILSELDITQPTLSHHMSVLVDSGAVNVRRDGRKAYYSINSSLISIIDELSSALKGEKTKAVPAAARVKRAPSVKPAPKSAAKAKPAKTSKPDKPKSPAVAEDTGKGKKKKDKKKKDKDKKKKK